MQHRLRCTLATAMAITFGTTKGNNFLAGGLVLPVVFLGGALVMPLVFPFRSFRVGGGGGLSGFIMPWFGRRVVSPLGLTGGRTTDGIFLRGVSATWNRSMLVGTPRGASRQTSPLPSTC